MPKLAETEAKLNNTTRTGRMTSLSGIWKIIGIDIWMAKLKSSNTYDIFLCNPTENWHSYLNGRWQKLNFSLLSHRSFYSFPPSLPLLILSLSLFDSSSRFCLKTAPTSPTPTNLPPPALTPPPSDPLVARAIVPASSKSGLLRHWFVGILREGGSYSSEAERLPTKEFHSSDCWVENWRRDGERGEEEEGEERRGL